MRLIEVSTRVSECSEEFWLFVAARSDSGATRGRGRAWSALGFDNLESVKIRVGDFSYCIASLA